MLDLRAFCEVGGRPETMFEHQAPEAVTPVSTAPRFSRHARRLAISALVSSIALCSGCAHTPPAGTASSTPPAAPVSETITPVLYDLLLGEIAGQRQRVDISTQNYLSAAERSRDPRIAERALQIANFANDMPTSLKVARRWLELDPAALPAHQALAVGALQQGDMAAAVTHLEQLIAYSADPRQGYQQVFLLLGRSPDPDRERPLHVMALLIERHPQDPHAHLAQAQLLLQFKRDPALALAAADKALGLKPDWSEARLQRAGILVLMGRADEAFQDLAGILERTPNDRNLRLNYARLLQQAKRTEAARAQFSALLQTNADDADALFGLAWLELDAGNSHAARPHLLHLVELGVNSDDARYFLGRAGELENNNNEAVRWYKTVFQGQYALDAQTRIALLLARSGDLAQARSLLRSLRERAPAFALQIYLAEGEILAELKHYPQAKALYDEALATQVDQVDLLYARALLAERMGRLDLAEQDLQRILALNPKHTHALNALGYTLADHATRLDEAKSYIERALAQDPDEPMILDSLGWVEYRLGNLDASARHLRRAFELTGNAEIGAHLGEVLWALGNQTEARVVWDKAKLSDPANEVLQRTLQRMLP